jgi:hypothetical protein
MFTLLLLLIGKLCYMFRPSYPFSDVQVVLVK